MRCSDQGCRYEQWAKAGRERERERGRYVCIPKLCYAYNQQLNWRDLAAIAQARMRRGKTRSPGVEEAEAATGAKAEAISEALAEKAKSARALP